MNYFVVDPTGNSYGPADLATLKQWMMEGRVLPETTIRDGNTGQTMTAANVPGLYPVPTFGPAAYVPPPSGYSPYAGGPMGSASADVQQAWIFAVLGLFCCGLIFGVFGVMAAKRAIAKGDASAQAPLIISYVAIGLWALGLLYQVFGRTLY